MLKHLHQRRIAAKEDRWSRWLSRASIYRESVEITRVNGLKSDKRFSGARNSGEQH